MTTVPVDSYLPPVGSNFFCLHWSLFGTEKQAHEMMAANGVPADATVYRTKDGSYWYPLQEPSHELVILP